MLNITHKSREIERTKNKTPHLKVRSDIRSGSIYPCHDAWCQAYCTPKGGVCTCLDDGSHTCDHYIVH